MNDNNRSRSYNNNRRSDVQGSSARYSGYNSGSDTRNGTSRNDTSRNAASHNGTSRGGAPRSTIARGTASRSAYERGATSQAVASPARNASRASARTAGNARAAGNTRTAGTRNTQVNSVPRTGGTYNAGTYNASARSGSSATSARSGSSAISARSGSSATSAARANRAGSANNAVRASRAGSANNVSRPGKKRGSVVKRIVIAVLAVLVIGGVALGVYLNNISSNLHKGVTEEVKEVLVETEYSQEPFYMLLMGTDESEERANDEYYGGAFRSDSMMLARIDCPNKKVTLISLERDTLVDMGSAGLQKLNAASTVGGPAYAIEMVSKVAHDTPISHYALIDFDGFCEVVDALGGIEVDVPIEINDDDAGGYLAAGLQTLNGEQALILCRSRHAYEEYGSGNTYRSANQRLVLSAIAQKILASDVTTIASTVSALSNYLTTDLELNDIIGIAQAMRGLDMTSDMYTAMQPTTSVYENDMWYNTSDEPEWQTMLERVDQGLSPTEGDKVDATGTVLATTGSGETLGGSNANTYVNQKSGVVAIRNGGAVTGSGGIVGGIVEGMGYTTDISNAKSSNYQRTYVIYSTEDQRSDALQIAQAIGAGWVVQNTGAFAMEGDFEIILGANYSSS